MLHVLKVKHQKAAVSLKAPDLLSALIIVQIQGCCNGYIVAPAPGVLQGHDPP